MHSKRPRASRIFRNFNEKSKKIELERKQSTFLPHCEFRVIVRFGISLGKGNSLQVLICTQMMKSLYSLSLFLAHII